MFSGRRGCYSILLQWPKVYLGISQAITSYAIGLVFLTRNAIIIGASSGIGASLAAGLSENGYSLGLVARRLDLLDEIANALPTVTLTRAIDVALVDESMQRLSELIDEMGGVDLFIISSGVGFENPNLDWAPEDETIQVNVAGFAAMVNVAARHLESRGTGHLVGISSIAAIRGNGGAPAYGASKAFVTNYLQAIRHRFVKAGLSISVTEIQPGFVDTAMAKGDGLFWVAPVPEASRQILRAIRHKSNHAYVTKRWRVIAWFLRWSPNWIYHLA